MDHRSKIILSVGVAAILVSIGVFAVLYSDYDHRVTFVTDPMNLSDQFVMIDDDTGHTSPVEKGAKVFDRTTISSVGTDIRFEGPPVITPESNTISCKCVAFGLSKTFVIWIHGADVAGVEVDNGTLHVHVTDVYYNFAVALSLSELTG